MNHRNTMKEFRTDDFLVKFLHPNRDGVEVEVYMRRRKRFPRTMSLHSKPIMKFNLKDLLGEEKKETAFNVFQKMIDKSQNATAFVLSDEWGEEDGESEGRDEEVSDN